MSEKCSSSKFCVTSNIISSYFSYHNIFGKCTQVLNQPTKQLSQSSWWWTLYSYPTTIALLLPLFSNMTPQCSSQWSNLQTNSTTTRESTTLPLQLRNRVRTLPLLSPKEWEACQYVARGPLPTWTRSTRATRTKKRKQQKKSLLYILGQKELELRSWVRDGFWHPRPWKISIIQLQQESLVTIAKTTKIKKMKKSNQ